MVVTGMGLFSLVTAEFATFILGAIRKGQPEEPREGDT